MRINNPSVNSIHFSLSSSLRVRLWFTMTKKNKSDATKFIYDLNDFTKKDELTEKALTVAMEMSMKSKILKRNSPIGLWSITSLFTRKRKKIQ